MIALVSTLRVGLAKELPPKPPMPDLGTSNLEALSKKLINTSDSYFQYLLDDSKSFNLDKVVDSIVMTKVFPYKIDKDTKELVPNKAVRVGPLAITLTKAKAGSQTKHAWDLIVENKTRHYLAYNVQTELSLSLKQCRLKGATTLKHNAIVLRPREKIRRSECQSLKPVKIKVAKVESMKVPEISYFYLSAVPPKSLALDLRTSIGHDTGSSIFKCSMVSRVSLTRDIKNKKVGWRDLIDFYGRHRCKSYSYVRGYKAFDSDNQTPLPAAEESFESGQ